MRPSRRSAFLLALALTATVASAETIGRNGRGAAGLATIPRGPACGTEVLTRSTSQTITALNSVSCNSQGLHADNSYFRTFDVSAYPAGLDVCSVEVGVELADAGDPATTQPVTVTVSAHSGAAFPAGTLAVLGTNNFSMPDAALSVVSVPLVAAVPAGTTDIVVEVFTPDGQTAGHSFFIGSNNLGESAPSWLEAADCGITSPTTTGAIGFANMQFVLNVVGNPPGGGGGTATSFDVAVPTLSEVGLGLLVAALALAGFFLMRRSS